MSQCRPERARGAALATALCLVVIALMIGVSAARAAFGAATSARHERDRQVAFFAAEAALRDAGRELGTGARAASFDGSAHAFVAGCAGSGASQGLCQLADKHAPPAWQAADLEHAAVSVALGQFTGARMATAVPGQPQRLPRYVIEFLPPHAATPTHASFRITAIGFGAHDGTRVVLQALYRKDLAVPMATTRHGWREIANWPELHATATD